MSFIPPAMTAALLLAPGGSNRICFTPSYALRKASLKSPACPVTAKTRPESHGRARCQVHKVRFEGRLDFTAQNHIILSPNTSTSLQVISADPAASRGSAKDKISWELFSRKLGSPASPLLLVFNLRFRKQHQACRCRRAGARFVAKCVGVWAWRRGRFSRKLGPRGSPLLLVFLRFRRGRHRPVEEVEPCLQVEAC